MGQWSRFRPNLDLKRFLKIFKIFIFTTLFWEADVCAPTASHKFGLAFISTHVFIIFSHYGLKRVMFFENYWEK